MSIVGEIPSLSKIHLEGPDDVSEGLGLSVDPIRFCPMNIYIPLTHRNTLIQLVPPKRHLSGPLNKYRSEREFNTCVYYDLQYMCGGVLIGDCNFQYHLIS